MTIKITAISIVTLCWLATSKINKNHLYDCACAA